MTIFLRCSERREQGSIQQLRGRQVYTGRGEGSSCCCMSLGTSFTYNTASLLTSCPHTKSHQQAHILPCLHCWNIFLPWGLSETHWKHSSCKDVLCHRSALLSLTSFHQLLFLPHLPFFLRIQALPSSYISIHIFSTFPPPSLHQWWEQAFILPSHICLHATPASAQASSATLTLCSCSNF